MFIRHLYKIGLCITSCTNEYYNRNLCLFIGWKTCAQHHNGCCFMKILYEVSYYQQNELYIRKYWSRSILTVDPIFKIEITYLQMFSVGIFIFKTLVYGIHFQKQKHILNAKGYDSFNGNKVTLLWFILDECLLKYSNYSRWCMASVYQELLLSSSVLTSSKLQFRFFQGIFIFYTVKPRYIQYYFRKG